MKKKYSIWNNYSYLYKRLWEYDTKLFLFNIAEIVTNSLLPLTSAILPALIVGLLENKCDTQTLVITCLIAFSLVGILNATATYLQNRNWLFYIFLRLEKFWGTLLKKAMNLDYALYEQDETQNTFGKAFNSVNNNDQGVEGFYHHSTTLFTSIIGLIIYSLVLSNCHPLLVICLLILSFIQYLFYAYARNYEDKHRDEQAIRERHQFYLFTQAYDVKSGKDIRLYQLQNWLTNIFRKYNRDFQNQSAKIQRKYFLYDFVGLVLQLLRDFVCYGYLIYLLTQGMDISEFVLYLGVISGFGNWFNQISSSLAKITRCSIQTSQYRITEDLNNIYLHDNGKELNLKDNESFDIVFDDVSFSYPNSDKLILDHLSFHINSKEKIALVGVNGAGKTTLVKMLCGFYKPTSGKILINGIDLNEINIEKYFDQISVLFQDSILLSFTIAENIIGDLKEKMNPQQLQQVLKLSGLEEKIHSLEKKELTYLGKDVEMDGIQLSGGQIQKLFLARALYKNAHMMILDEPTAALDAIAENEMYQKYAELVNNKTSIFISHRLSSTRFCDQIYFLENGKIKESGTHEELMKLNGSYANMFNIQSQYYVKEDESNETK